MVKGVEPLGESSPSCVKMAMFDGRLATKVDAVGCPHEHGFQGRFAVNAGIILGREEVAYNAHGFRTWYARPVDELLTDDEGEAEAAYERFERWVRTGELDEG